MARARHFLGDFEHRLAFGCQRNSRAPAQNEHRGEARLESIDMAADRVDRNPKSSFGVAQAGAARDVCEQLEIVPAEPIEPRRG